MDFLLPPFQLWFVRALLIGLGGFALVQYLRHRSGSNLAFALGGLLVTSGATLEAMVLSFFTRTVETETGGFISFPIVPYRLGMVLLIAGCGTCIVTGLLRILGIPRPLCEKND